MIHTLRAALAVVALTALPQFASAGPISWGYRAVAPDGTVLVERSGITELDWGDFFLPNPREYGTMEPDPFPDSGLISDIWRTSATVTIIDERSGESGQLPIFRGFLSEYELNPDGSHEPIHQSEFGGPWWPEPARLELGGNVYRVRTPGGEFLVNVEPGPGPPPLQTPEPGSFALAALGLGALGLRFRRRVRAVAVAVLMCAGLFGTNATASAGPITWEYQTRVIYDQDYGSKFTVALMPGERTATTPGDYYQIALFGSTGVARPDPGSYEVRYGFTVEVAVTDVASGEQGTLAFTGWYTSHWTYQPEDANDPNKWRWDYEVSGFGDPHNGQTLERGGNRYTVRAYGGGPGIMPQGELTVSIDPIATPEPGTLALAVFGIGGAFARRLRRVRIGRGAVVAALVCLALFGASETATAGPIPSPGPIEWSMRSDPDYTRFGNEFYFGTYNRPLPGDGTEVVRVYGQMPEGLLPVGAGSQNNILLAAHSKNTYRYDSVGPTNPAATNQVPYTVWVTDVASGESGFLTFELAAFFLTGMPLTDTGEVVFGGSGGGSLVLGGNKYNLAFNTSDGDEGTYITANLTVAPVASTPEPGTLALAGLGVGALGLVRRLRRGA